MKLRHLQTCVSAVFFCVVISVFPVQGQSKDDAVDPGKRQQAMQLFEQGKRLEALPLLEELVQKTPKDDELLVALAASLVRHAATLTDQQAAAKERFRAKNLVQEALDFGNNSPLAQNLRQLLGAMPLNGTMQFSENPSVEQAMLEGEAAFSRRDFAEAIKSYAKALELEPKNYAAALFIGNTYHKQDDY